MIAIDLPGFGDSDKPLGAPYDARFFATAIVQLLDALELDRAHLIGNSLGGRVALEVGLRAPRARRPPGAARALAGLAAQAAVGAAAAARAPRARLLPHAPRPVVARDRRPRRPGRDDGWTAAGIDEFLRAFLTPRGRAAFYATARQIYLEEPEGEKGFWTRLRELEPDRCSSGAAGPPGADRLRAPRRRRAAAAATSSSTAATCRSSSARARRTPLIAEFLLAGPRR